MTRPRLVLLAILASWSSNTLTQATAEQTKATLRGRVVVAERPNVPVRKALVTLRTTDGNRTTDTDDQGVFYFLNLASGIVSVTISKPGSPTVEFGSRLPNTSGTPIVLTGGQETFINVQLPSGSVISGTIRGPSGDPIPDSPVWVIRAGATGTTTSPAAVTDDRGAYRAYGLEAGDYVVTSLISTPGTGLMAVLGTNDIDVALAELAGRPGTRGAASSEVRTHASYAPIFYPGTPISSRATVVTLSAGEERSGIDFLFDLVRTSTIEGTLGLPSGIAQGINVRLLADRVFSLPQGSTVLATTSPESFRFDGIPPGHYRVVASTRTLTGARTTEGTGRYGAIVDLDVAGDSNVLPVHVQLRPLLTLSGRFEFVSSVLRPPTMSDIRLTLAERSSLGTSAIPNDAAVFSRTVSARGAAEGRFELDGLFPGDYTLTVEGHPPSWFLESAIINGVDLLDVPPQLTEANLANVVVTFSDQASSLAGRLVAEKLFDFQTLSIVVFAADESLRGSPRRQRMVRPRTDGTFDAGVLPQGRYLVAVVPSAVPVAAANDPAYLANVSATAVPLAIERGERKTLTISVR